MRNKILQWERKAERSKFPNLIWVFLGASVVGYFLELLGTLGVVSPTFFFDYLSLDIGKVMKGEVWRIVTYLFANQSSSLISLALLVFVYISISKTLEQIVGRFRTNFYLILGWFIQIVFAFLYYLVCQTYIVWMPYSIYTEFFNTYEIYSSLFILFALSLPDARILLFFILPIKASWFIYIALALDIFAIAGAFMAGETAYGIILIILLFGVALDILIFYLIFGKSKRSSRFYRKASYGPKAKPIHPASESYRHKCVVCGRTDITNPELSFRYCTQCIGNYEYCENHIHSHMHRKPGDSNFQ